MISYVESKEQKQKTQAHRHREQIGGCQRWELGAVGKMSAGGQKVQTSSYKISHQDVTHGTVIVVANSVLHT